MTVTDPGVAAPSRVGRLPHGIAAWLRLLVAVCGDHVPRLLRRAAHHRGDAVQGGRGRRHLGGVLRRRQQAVRPHLHRVDAGSARSPASPWASPRSLVLDGNHVLRELPARPWLWGLIGGVVVGGAMFLLAALGPDEQSAGANPLRLRRRRGLRRDRRAPRHRRHRPTNNRLSTGPSCCSARRSAPSPSAPCGPPTGGSPRRVGLSALTGAGVGWLVGAWGGADYSVERAATSAKRWSPRSSRLALFGVAVGLRRPPPPTRRRRDRAAVTGVDLRRAGPRLHRRRPADPARADDHPVAREQRQQRVRRHRQLPDRDHEPRVLHGGELGLGQHLRQPAVLDRRRRHGHRPRHRPGQRARRPPPLRGDPGLDHRPARSPSSSPPASCWARCGARSSTTCGGSSSSRSCPRRSGWPWRCWPTGPRARTSPSR